METEILDFLSQSDNYKHAKEIAAYLPKVESKFKKDFWDKVRDKFLDKTSEDWKAVIEFERNADNVRFYKPGWKQISITIRDFYESPHYGVYCMKSYFKDNEYAICQNEIKNKYPNYPYNSDWLNYTYIDSWHNSDLILRLLPENADVFAEQIVDIVWSYIENVLPVCERLNQARV